MKFLRPFPLEIERRKSAKKIAKIGRHFSQSLVKFRQNFALGDCGDNFWQSIFAIFRTIHLLPFSGCHFDSPDADRLYHLLVLVQKFSHFDVSILSGMICFNKLFLESLFQGLF